MSNDSELDILVDSLGNCRNFLSQNRTEVEEFNEKVLYGLFVPSVIIILVFAFLRKRKNLWLQLLDGRPAVPEPILLIDEQTNRGTFVAGFMLGSSLLLEVITGSSIFPSWEYPYYLSGLMMTVICLLLGVLFYPIFAGATMRDIPSLIIASIFTWAWSIFLIIVNGPCMNYRTPKDWIFQGFEFLPTLSVLLYLSIVLPYRAGVLIFCPHKATGQFLVDNEKVYQVIHVRNIFQTKNRNQQQSIGQRVKTFYPIVPGFRYNLTILCAVLVSIFMIYNLAVDLWHRFDNLAELTVRAVSHLEVWQGFVDKYRALLQGFEWFLGKDILEPGTLLREARFWSILLRIVLTFALIIAFSSTSVSLLFTMRNYRKQLLCLYRGVYKGIPRYNVLWSPRNIVVTSAKYMGYQMAYAIWGFIIQLVLYFCILLAVTVLVCLVWRYKMYWILEKLAQKLVPPLVTIFILLVMQHLIVFFFFLLRNVKGQQVLAIDNRRWFSNFQYFMVFVNVALGLLSCLLRIFKAVIFGVWSLPRLDVSTLSRSFEKFDNGFSAYVSLLCLQNVQTNPILVVFCNLLWENLRDKKTGSNKILFSHQGTKVSRQQIIRNRWLLFVTLYNNPGLRQFRNMQDNEQILSIDGMLIKSGLSAVGNGWLKVEDENKLGDLVGKGLEINVSVNSQINS